MEIDYSTLIMQLKSGELGELEVKPDEFMSFYDAYMACDYRKRIVGSASKKGIITYKYSHDHG